MAQANANPPAAVVANPFNNQTHTAFWTNGPQMSLSAQQRARLALEGLALVTDFADFDEETLNDAFKNMKISLPGDPNAAPPVPPVIGVPLSAKQKFRIQTARIAFKYLMDTGRPVTPQTMNYTSSLKDFRTEWDSIVKLEEQKSNDLPTISRELQVMQWQPAFVDHLSTIFGVRGIPLTYIIREKVAVTAHADDPFLPGKLHGSSESILEDLVSRCDHTHPLYKTDNNKVYKLLAEATLGTQYATTVTTFSRRKDGRAAYLALVTSHVGKDKWDQTVESSVDLIMNRKWNGMSYKLEKFCNQHRQAHAKLTDAKENGADVPDINDTSKVKYLISNITHQDSDLRAAIALIRNDQPAGTKSNFENAVKILLPVDPFKPRGGGKRKFEVSSVEGGSKTSANKISHGTGKTGVELCFHKPKEYKNLTSEQKEELRQWRQSDAGKRAVKSEKQKGKQGAGKALKKKEIAAIEALVKLHEQEEEKKEETEEITEEEKTKDKTVAAIQKVKKILKRTRFTE